MRTKEPDRLCDPPLSRRAFLLQHFEDWVICPRILTFKIKQIPFCYILTKFERSMNAEQHMCNIEKDIWGNSRNSDFGKYINVLSRDYMTKLASRTGCVVCLRNDS